MLIFINKLFAFDDSGGVRKTEIKTPPHGDFSPGSPEQLVPQRLSLNGMVLCFYTAYLFRLTSINSAKTIQNYSSQLKSA